MQTYSYACLCTRSMLVSSVVERAVSKMGFEWLLDYVISYFWWVNVTSYHYLISDRCFISDATWIFGHEISLSRWAICYLLRKGVWCFLVYAYLSYILEVVRHGPLFAQFSVQMRFRVRLRMEFNFVQGERGALKGVSFKSVLNFYLSALYAIPRLDLSNASVCRHTDILSLVHIWQPPWKEQFEYGGLSSSWVIILFLIPLGWRELK